jgi:tRNA-dihydrouridine synthase 1
MSYNKEALKQFAGPLDQKYVCSTCPYCNGTKDPSVKFPKPAPHQWWATQLGSPKYVVAPMVEQSELPFRMLCRRFGAHLAYTPMFHSRSFAESAEYRRKEFSTCPADRPLFVQFCGHDPETVLAAARHVEDCCDAVDINLGCPQGIARRGFYGAFLMEHWDIIHTIIHTLAVELRVPVTAKMRLYDDEQLTLRYAAMLRDAGAHVITVHGRTREQKGQQTGLANLDMIRRVREHVGRDVPVVENGNILTFSDIEPNLQATGCNAVMSAEALLWDPRLFANPARPVLTGRGFNCEKRIRLDAIETAFEYLNCLEEFPVELGFAKAHLFKILYHSYEIHPAFRVELGDFNCGAGEAHWMRDHVQRLLAAEEACSVEMAPAKVLTQEKLAAKEAARVAAVEESESYGIDF